MSTSLQRSEPPKTRGMTLIEILMVLAIVGLIVQAAASGFGPALEAEKMRAVNQLVSTVNYAYNRARVHGVYLRMEIDLDEKKFSLQEAQDAMYLPSTDRSGRMVEVDEAALEERDERDRAAAEIFNESLLNRLKEIPGRVLGGGDKGEGDKEEGEEGSDDGDSAQEDDPYAGSPRTVPRARAPLFSSFKDENALSGLGEAIELPDGIRVMGVRTDADIKTIREGKAYLYFFPTGRTQRAHIMLQDIDEAKEDENAGSTIVVSPLTGKVKVLPQVEELVLPEDYRGGVDDLGRKLERRSF